MMTQDSSMLALCLHLIQEMEANGEKADDLKSFTSLMFTPDGAQKMQLMWPAIEAMLVEMRARLVASPSEGR